MKFFEFENAGENAVSQATDFPAGLLYGFSIFTTFRLPLSARWLDAHLERLKRDACAVGLAWDFPDEALKSWIHCCAGHPDSVGKPVARLTLFPEVGGYGEFYAERARSLLPSRLACFFRQAADPPFEGVSLKICGHSRFMPQVKWGALADMILLRREALREGYDDVLLVNASGNISETSTANIFLTDGRGLLTPDPGRDGCLPGITRLQVMEAASAAGIPVRMDPIPVGLAAEARGAFLTNAAQGLIPVRAIDSVTLPWPQETKDLLLSLRKRLECS